MLMSVVAPSPSTARGEPVLQPSYFTSSVYVSQLRADISTLILKYHEAYFRETPTQPFALFKTVWVNEGWDYLHFIVFDHRSRKAFLESTTRLFMERTVKTEAPFMRVVALFGAYLFHYTQPTGNAPPIYSVKYIPISYDQLGPLIDLATSLQDKPLAPLQPHVSHVISRMMRDEVFHILPRSDLYPLAPRELPREIVGEDPRPDILGRRGKGRPSKRDKAKQSRAAMERLDQWSRTQIDDSEAMMPDEEYVQIRQALAQHKESVTSIISTLQK